MIHASMGPGEENSGKLVSQVRRRAREIAREKDASVILTDGPPGTGCAAISSITGTDAVLLVIESSMSSLHDAKRMVDLVNQFQIPMFAIINKFDINLEVSSKIGGFLEEQSIPLLGKIPFDESVVHAMISGQSLTEYAPDSSLSGIFHSVWKQLMKS
jgi:MinD superfamily P-loop ATPase